MNRMTKHPMGCEPVRGLFSGYLDGAISGREMQAVASHLEQCAGCTRDFDAWRGMQQTLAAMGPLKAPADLGLKLRLAVSHEAARREGRALNSLKMRWENLIRPMVLQVSAGFAGAVVLIGTIALMIGAVAAPEAVLANDEPLGALTQPHFLYDVAQTGPVTTPEDAPVVIEARVNEEGRVYDYTIVSGPHDAATQAAIRDELLLEVYAPARVFGEPVRGQVLITFAGITVKG